MAVDRTGMVFRWHSNLHRAGSDMVQTVVQTRCRKMTGIHTLHPLLYAKFQVNLQEDEAKLPAAGGVH